MSGKFLFDRESVKQLAEILVETGLTEIEYENNGSRIYVSRKQQVIERQINERQPSYSQLKIDEKSPSPNEPSTSPTTQGENNWENHTGVVKSPMVGIAYLASAPGGPPFVKIGDKVSEGDPLLIIEAMKVMNQIKAPKSGSVVHMFIKDASPVEYNQPLVVIE